MKPEPTITQNEDGTQFVPFSAQCRFCGIALNCMVDPAGVAEKPSSSTVAFTAGMLRQMAACNRCADVRRTAWRVEAAYKKNADKLMIATIAGKGKTIEADVRAGFKKTTDWWLDYLCKAYRISDLRDDDLVDTLVRKPAAYPALVVGIRKMVEQAAREAWSTKPLD